MKTTICKVSSQIYLLPYIKITYERELNGDLELIIGWFKGEVVFAI